MRDLDGMVSEHFRWRELVESDLAVRAGLENLPHSEETWMNLEAVVVACAEPARVVAGPIIVSSGYRCGPLNKIIGGKPGSQHVRGEALDLKAQDLSVLWTALEDTPFDQLIWEFGAWVHVSHSRSGIQRQQRLIAVHDEYGRAVYTQVPRRKQPWEKVA